jgi:hypothetical protein
MLVRRYLLYGSSIFKTNSELNKDTRNSANNFLPQKFYAVIKSAINANLK